MGMDFNKDKVVVEVNNVTVKYGKVIALKNVSMSICNGEKVMIIGPNGSGKTTLLKLLMGFVKPLKGSVRIFGYDPSKIPLNIRKRIAIVTERASAPMYLRIRDYLSIVLDVYGARDSKWINNVLNVLGLDRILSRRIGSLSQGYRKRVEIAAALAVKPKLLLLDEPYANVDPVTRLVIDKALNDLGEGVTTIITSHVPPTPYLGIDRVIALIDGNVAWSGSTTYRISFTLRCVNTEVSIDNVRILESLIKEGCIIKEVKIEDPYLKVLEALMYKTMSMGS
ncbi:MAG: ABC transporter ATP-binding protein [Crenarchaeota archaeon]|nr:ABC transporter ATP-binding protein [Thermoproteota archaeon]